MKGKLFGVLAVFLIGLLSLSIVSADDFGALGDVEIDGKDLTDNMNRLRDYDRGDKLTLEFDVMGDTLFNITGTNTSDTIENVRVEALLRGDSHGDDIEDITDRFDVKADRVYAKTLEFELPGRMDRDIYTLILMITSRDGILDTQEIQLSIASGGEDHKLIVKDTLFQQSGRALLSTVKIENRGTKDEDDVKVSVEVPALGLKAEAFLDEVEAEGEDDDVVVSEELYMRIPSDALTGDYKATVTLEYDDGDEITTEDYTIHVEGTAPVVETETVEEAKVQISFIEAQELTAGEAGTMYPITIQNPTSEDKTVIVSVEGVDAFGEAVVEPSNVFIVEAGSTKMIPLYVSADEDAAEGEHTFTVTISGLSDDDQTIVMTADVAESEENDAGWNNIKKGLEIALIVLVVLLVLLGLIIGFGKLRGNDDEDDEAQTYY